MHTGKIKKLVLERGFGFIADTDGNEVFFHKNSLKDLDFNSLSSGQDVAVPGLNQHSMVKSPHPGIKMQPCRCWQPAC